jgi:protein transport protein SEC24
VLLSQLPCYVASSLMLNILIAMYDELHIPRKEIREKLSELCVKILSAYRANCASSTSPGQLILPEAFKLLPVYTTALLRSKALRGGKNSMQVSL